MSEQIYYLSRDQSRFLTQRLIPYMENDDSKWRFRQVLYKDEEGQFVRISYVVAIRRLLKITRNRYYTSDTRDLVNECIIKYKQGNGF